MNAVSICDVYSRRTRYKEGGRLGGVIGRPNKRVAVVGAGMGGLAAAIRWLAAMGFDVEVSRRTPK